MDRGLGGLNLLEALKGEHLGFLSACPGVGQGEAGMTLQSCSQSDIKIEFNSITNIIHTITNVFFQCYHPNFSSLSILAVPFSFKNLPSLNPCE